MKNNMVSVIMPTILGAVALGLIGGGIPYGIYSLVQNKNNKVNDEPFKEDRISSPIHKEIPKQSLVIPQPIPKQKDDNKPNLPGVGSANFTISRTWEPTSDPFKLNIHEDVEQCTLGLQRGQTCWLMSGACAINSFLDEKDRMKSQDDALVNFYKARAMEEAIYPYKDSENKTCDSDCCLREVNPVIHPQPADTIGRFVSLFCGLNWRPAHFFNRNDVLESVKKHFSDGNVTPLIVGWSGHFISFLKYDDNNGFTIYNSLRNDKEGVNRLEIGKECKSLPNMSQYDLVFVSNDPIENSILNSDQVKNAIYKVSWKDGNKNREEICEGLFALRQCLKEDVKIKVSSVKVLRDDGKPDYELLSDSNLKIEKIESN